MAFETPPLPYAYDALEPHIDVQTMTNHHDKHHATYVTNLNAAVGGTEFEGWDIEKLMRDISQVPAEIRTAVQNNGGGHANHSLFWSVMDRTAAASRAAPWPTPSTRRAAASRASRKRSPTPAPSVSAAAGRGWSRARTAALRCTAPPTRTAP